MLSNLVEGVDFMIPSDHDIIYDYASLIERMGLSHRITAPLTGEEVSPRSRTLGCTAFHTMSMSVRVARSVYPSMRAASGE